MNMINNVTAMDVATMAAMPSATVARASAPDGDRIDAFNKLLFAGTPQGDAGSFTPAQMLEQQATVMGASVGVDLGAKVAGAVSQSVNKLANMT